MGEKKFLESIEDGELDIAVYARSWEEGDNVTVTCDLLFAMEQAVGAFNEQSAKIEQLTEENKQVKVRCENEMIALADGKDSKIIKLQKRVDELAKEILTEIGKEPCEHAYLNWDCEWYKRICKKYGVEVE